MTDDEEESGWCCHGRVALVTSHVISRNSSSSTEDVVGVVGRPASVIERLVSIFSQRRASKCNQYTSQRDSSHSDDEPASSSIFRLPPTALQPCRRQYIAQITGDDTLVAI